jgi:phosphoglycerate dehydrogenase-like enzyme
MAKIARAASERRAQAAAQLLGLGATGTVVGLALGVLGAGGVGVAVAASGFAMLLLGLHRYGRLGPDPGPDLEQRR